MIEFTLEFWSKYFEVVGSSKFKYSDKFNSKRPNSVAWWPILESLESST